MNIEDYIATLIIVCDSQPGTLVVIDYAGFETYILYYKSISNYMFKQRYRSKYTGKMPGDSRKLIFSI